MIYLLLAIIVILIFYIISTEVQMKKICRQMEEGKGRYINVRTASSNKSLEGLVVEINKLYDGARKIEIENKKVENEIRRGIANMSHDLRTPLTSVRGYIQLLDDVHTTQVQREEYLEIIKKRTEHLQRLVTSFFDLSRLDSNEYKFDLKAVNMSEILVDSIGTYYDAFEEMGIEPSIEIDETVKRVIADSSAISRIFSNLISNMIKYGDGGVEIKLYKEDSYVISEFSNLAYAVTQEDVGRLFERFYTVEKSRTTKSTGLGLSIVKSMVLKLNGEIETTLKNSKLTIKIKWK